MPFLTTSKNTILGYNGENIILKSLLTNILLDTILNDTEVLVELVESHKLIVFQNLRNLGILCLRY